MRAANFEEVDIDLQAPPGVDGVSSLPVCRNLIEVYMYQTSLWRASWKDRIMFLLTGKMWVTIMSGTHPPLRLQVSKPNDVLSPKIEMSP